MTTRRNFLAGTAAAAAFPPSIQRALAIPAHRRTGTIQDIKHVVILMQENRSFDHYFGTLKGVRGYGDRFPIPLESGKPVWFESDGAKEIPPYHIDSTTKNAQGFPGTPHSYSDMQAAWNQGKMGYWPKFKTQYTMGYYKREDIPFQFALAEAFTICDGNHCAITTGTDPNRVIFWSGAVANPALTKQGINSTQRDSEPNNDRCWPNPSVWVAGLPQPQPTYKYPDNDLTWETLPDVLEKAGISWHIYQDMNNNWTGAMNGCLAFASFRHAQPGDPNYVHGLTGGPDFLAQLKNDVLNGTLPQVSWILPTPEQSEHPTYSPIEGANFTATILDALTSNPDVWAQTAFIITYDENDGLFDHLAPPAVPSYDVNGNLMGKSTLPLAGEYFDTAGYGGLDARDTISGGIRPWGYGPRVPMYVISPWSKGGWVNSQAFDHTSVALFLEKRFGVTVDAVSPWHRAISGDLTSAFDFVSPNDPSFPTLPDVSNWAAIQSASNKLPTAVPPATPEPLFQETGVRYARALPYILHASAHVDASKGTVRILFVNTGFQGAVFHVYDKKHLDLIPRRYTVEAGKLIDDEWIVDEDGQYDLWVIGPNGFHRYFTGDITAVAEKHAPNPEIFVGYDCFGGGVHLQLRNDGSDSVQFTVKSNKIYGPLFAVSSSVSAFGPVPHFPGFGPFPGIHPVGFGPVPGFGGLSPVFGKPGFGFAPPVFVPGPVFGPKGATSWNATVHGGRPSELYWNLGATGLWYDFVVTSDTDPSFSRRFAGHVETGRPSVSDPGMGLTDQF